MHLSLVENLEISMKYHAYNPNELFMTVVVSNYYQLRVTSISMWVSFSIDENEKISSPAVKDLTLDSKVRFLKKEEEKLRHVSKHSNAIFIYKRETFQISSKSSLKPSQSATDVIQNWRNRFCSFFSLDQLHDFLMLVAGKIAMLLKVVTETEKVVEEASESHFWAAFLSEFQLSYYPTNSTPSPMMSLTLTEAKVLVLH